MIIYQNRFAKFYSRIRPFRNYLIIFTDSIVVGLSFLAAFFIRFDFNLPYDQLELFYFTLPIVLAVRVLSFRIFKLHSAMWHYFSFVDARTILSAVTASSIFSGGIILLIVGHGFPRGVLFLDWILCMVMVCGVRLVGRVVRESFFGLNKKNLKVKRVIIIGAGDAGESLMREIRRGMINDGYKYHAVGFVDDDPEKWGDKIQGCEILGSIEDLSGISRTKGVDELLIALPAASQNERRRVILCCRETGLPFKTIPSFNDLLQGRLSISQVQEVEPEDILEREPVSLDLEGLRKEISGKGILVTGAAGSIGSEICRQLAKFNPKKIILYDRAESNLYLLELELKQKLSSVIVEPVIGDILNGPLLDEVISVNCPEFIFHVAAYKHVPLMESFPLEAIQNNIFGSETVGRAAIKGDVRKVVFISTDKAVRPVGVMGMTKRISECLLQALGNGSTEFVAVRFGNVLGSDGSVLGIFKSQIEKGAPLTITDSSATRYFMLISEAAKLVVQVSVMGKGGEIFFLDMGDPVGISDLAEKLVLLSGYEIHKDVHISHSGLRPGERLQEALVMEEEVLLSTEHEKIFAVKSEPLDYEVFVNDFECLRRLLNERDQWNALALLKKMAVCHSQKKKQ